MPMPTLALGILCLLLPFARPATIRPFEPQDPPSAAEPDGRVEPQIVAGPMVGHVAHDRARIWLQGNRHGWVNLQYRAAGAEDWRTVQHPLRGDKRFFLDPENDFAAVCDLPGLAPATRYEYRFAIRGGPVPAQSEQSFQTPPAPGTAEDFTVAFGSCAGEWGADPTQPVFGAVDALHPEVFLWLGDNVYYELPEREWYDEAKMAARWKTQRAMESLQPLLRRTAHYAVWDDHDYGPDNSDKLYPLRDDSLALFVRYWANPGYGSDGVRGVWHRFQRGRVEFFLLDTRYHREPNFTEPGPGKTMLGEAQWRWLERSLAASRADFKVIVSSTQVLARYHVHECWGLFPADWERLVALLARERIGGVLFLSGDRHSGELLRRQPEGFAYPLHELTSSPLAAGIGVVLPDAAVADRLPGTLVAAENFGVLAFHFDGPEGPRVELGARDVQGEPLYEPVVVRRAEIGF